MFRIDDVTAATALPTPGAAGAEGYWTQGNPGAGLPATLLTADFLNMVQEELRAVVVAGGLTPSKTNNGQLVGALVALFGAGRAGHIFTPSDWVPLPGGLILQWCRSGNVAVTAGVQISVSATFPIAFPSQSLFCAPVSFTPDNINTNTFVSSIGGTTTTATAAVNSAISQNVNVMFLAIGK